MIRKLGVMAISLAMVGASMAATVAGKDARDTSDSPAWAPIGLSLLSYPMQIPTVEHSVFGAMLNIGAVLQNRARDSVPDLLHEAA